MRPLPQISEAEFEVMKIVWKCGLVSTNEITDRLTASTSWSPKTIQTMIKRLVTKGALSYKKEGRMFIYTPLVSEKDYIGQKSRSFLKRYFDGNLTALVSSYLEEEQLTVEEIDSLRSLLSRESEKGGD